ncbi:hypothetical protein GC56T2_1558 [Geobacillus sp. C56-T2]|nr:hypothetical protein GC56T2_1558 [Geobacillus sp. C56-T2]
MAATIQIGRSALSLFEEHVLKGVAFSYMSSSSLNEPEPEYSGERGLFLFPPAAHHTKTSSGRKGRGAAFLAGKGGRMPDDENVFIRCQRQNAGNRSD